MGRRLIEFSPPFQRHRLEVAVAVAGATTLADARRRLGAIFVVADVERGSRSVF